MLDIAREAVHISSLVILCTVVLVAIVGTFKPHLLRVIFKEFTERKYILASAVFVCLLCGTIFTATQPISRPFDSSKSGVPNTAGSLGQPSRQVYGQNGSQEEDVASTGSGLDRSEDTDTSRARDTNQSSQETKAQTPVSEAQESGGSPPKPTALTQNNSETETTKECRVLQLGSLCL